MAHGYRLLAADELGPDPGGLESEQLPLKTKRRSLTWRSMILALIFSNVLSLLSGLHCASLSVLSSEQAAPSGYGRPSTHEFCPSRPKGTLQLKCRPLTPHGGDFGGILPRCTRQSVTHGRPLGGDSAFSRFRGDRSRLGEGKRVTGQHVSALGQEQRSVPVGSLSLSALSGKLCSC